MSKNVSLDTIETVAQQAIQWMIDLENNKNTNINKEFVDWLKSSPIHVQEFLYLSQIMLSIENNKMKCLDDILKFYRITSNIIPLKNNQKHTKSKVANNKKRFLGLKVAAIILSLSLLITSQFNKIPAFEKQFFSTLIGEQRSIILDDDSIIELNTDTNIIINFTKKLRTVELVSGEAIFQVTKDVNRPFRVISGSAFVEVVGTKFNMYKNIEGSTTITVVEGLVKVGENISDEKSKSSLLLNKPLRKGEQVIVNGKGKINTVTLTDLEKVISWKNRELVFKNNTLESVIKEINRYNKRKIIIKDDQLRQKKINGTFKTNDPQILLEFLTKVGKLNITINKYTNYWEISKN